MGKESKESKEHKKKLSSGHDGGLITDGIDEAADMLVTASLDQLQSVEYRQILDMIDRLRTLRARVNTPPAAARCVRQSVFWQVFYARRHHRGSIPSQ